MDFCGYGIPGYLDPVMYRAPVTMNSCCVVTLNPLVIESLLLYERTIPGIINTHLEPRSSG